MKRALLVCLIFSACAPRETAQVSIPPQPLPSPPPVASAAPSPAAAAPAEERADGLLIEDLRVGTGDELTPGETATVHYVGTLRDGTEFDSSRRRGQPFTSKIPGRLIKGWNEGLLGMRVGGIRRLTVPPALGYGDRPAGKIPPGSTLIFEIELLAVAPATP